MPLQALLCMLPLPELGSQFEWYKCVINQVRVCACLINEEVLQFFHPSTIANAYSTSGSSGKGHGQGRNLRNLPRSCAHANSRMWRADDEQIAMQMAVVRTAAVLTQQFTAAGPQLCGRP